MKRLFSILLLFTIFFPSMVAQHAIGSWQSYLSYHNVLRAEPAGEIIYALGNGGLFSYDKEDQTVHTYWKDNQLNDTDIADILYSKPNKTLVIVYTNGNIDLLVNDRDVYNLPDYMEKNMTQDKTINGISCEGDFAYLSTAFGIVSINLKKREISNTYTFNTNVNDCAVEGNQIYAATSDGLYTGLLTDNLLDMNNWRWISRVIYKKLNIYDDALIGNRQGMGIYRIDLTDFSSGQVIGGNYAFMNTYNDKLLAGTDGALIVWDKNDRLYYLEPGLGLSSMAFENGIYWASCKSNGLRGLRFNTDTREFTNEVSSVTPNSPKRNYIYDITLEGDRVLISGGGVGNRAYQRDGTIMMFDDNEWSYFQDDDIWQTTGIRYKDIIHVVQDPTDERRHFATSFGQGLYEFYDGEFVELYNYDNSTIVSALPNDPNAMKEYVRLGGMAYDHNNNLWMLNCTTDQAIQVMKNDGTWRALSFPALNHPTFFKECMFDRYGRLWAISALENDYGVFCLDYNGTIDLSTDDTHKFVTNFINQDGTQLSHKGVNCIVEDQDGAIWIGTAQGPIVLYNNNRFFESGYNCTQIKVPRNDGTNLADFLLASDNITAIAVDGANRKWIGTGSNGLYLVSPDGLETLEHFTKENSPLIDNTITSIAIHPTSGKVYIGTDKGLVSYQGDATEGADSFEESNVYAYPNPVRSGYTGVITVTGLKRDTDVKIINVGGELVYEGTSTGGQFTWNGRNRSGDRAASGVYFVLASDQDGKEGIVTKIVMLR